MEDPGIHADDTSPAPPPAEVVAAHPRRTHRAERGKALSTRVLVLGWCLWLLGSWIVLWIVAGWSTPALRSMVFSSMVGLMGVWPAVRLSQMTRRYPVVDDRGMPRPGEVSPQEWAGVCWGTLKDWLCLNLVFQVVIWPLQLTAQWTLMQVIWLDVAVASWSLLTGLLIAWGRGTDRGELRGWAMVMCVGVVILEPMLWWLGWPMGSSQLPGMRMSPLSAMWALSSQMTPDLAVTMVRQQIVQVVTVFAAAAMGWLVLWGLLGWALRRKPAR